MQFHWELCKELKFVYTNKWYLHNPESVLENETHNILWYFDIQTDPLISARRPDIVIVKKKKKKKKKKEKKRTCWIEYFAVPVDHRVKLIEGEKRNRCLDLSWELKNLWNMKVTVIPIVIGACGKGTGIIENKNPSGDHPNELRSTRILRRVLKACHSNTCQRPTADAGVKNSQRSKTLYHTTKLGHD